MTTVYITIGRNMGDKPMGNDGWLEYMRSCADALLLCGFTIVQQPHLDKCVCTYQIGVFEGKQEDSACFVATGNGNAVRLCARMRKIARAHEQQCFGLAIVGGNTLISV